jgi:hypothetical protein
MQTQHAIFQPTTKPPAVHEALQRAVDWNIVRRDRAKRAGSTADSRHFQQNIDRLNAELRTLS